MRKIPALFLVAISFIISNIAFAQDFFGLWNGSLDTFTFRPLGGNSVGMVVVTNNGYQDIYTEKVVNLSEKSFQYFLTN